MLSSRGGNVKKFFLNEYSYCSVDLMHCIIFVYVFFIICNRHLQREAEVLNEWKMAARVNLLYTDF